MYQNPQMQLVLKQAQQLLHMLIAQLFTPANWCAVGVAKSFKAMDSICNDVTRQLWCPQWWDALFVRYCVYGELPIEQYTFVCSSDQVTATWGRVVSFSSAKSGFTVGICCTTIRPFPSELHSRKDPFAFLFSSLSQSLTMASYFQISVSCLRPQEIAKSSIWNACDCHLQTIHDVVHLSIHSPESNQRW